MFDFNIPFDDLVTAVKSELVDWSEKRKPIVEYGLGFYRLPFYESREADGCALHVWLDGMPRNEDAHTHIFRLTSRVLCGQIEDARWEPMPLSEGKFLLSSYALTNGAYTKSGVSEFCDVRRLSIQTISRGGTYEVPKNVFHTSRVLNFPTVTLLQREEVDSNAIVQDLRPRDPQGHVSPQGTPLDGQRYESAWQRISQVLALV